MARTYGSDAPRSGSIRMAQMFLCCSLLASVLWGQSSDELQSSQDLDRAMLRSEDRVRKYSLLHRGQQTTYAFCGAGRLQVLSRAVLGQGKGVSSYALELDVDGQRPFPERQYRVWPARAAVFDSGLRATSLRRSSVQLGRGCHLLRLGLTRSSSERVAVRVLWRPEQSVRRRWQEVASQSGGRRAAVEVRGEQTPYRVLSPGETLQLEIEGPAWVRLRSRPLGRGSGEYPLEVQRNGKPYRNYRLPITVSRRAIALDDRTRNLGQPLGRSNEVVFAVEAGRQQLSLSIPGLSVLVRAQVAERNTTKKQGSGVSYRVRLASYYDDNILRYSERFIRRFDQGRDPGRFRVSSLDDWVQRLDLRVQKELAGWRDRPLTLGLDLGHRAYVRNGIKDWTRLELGLEQALGRGRRLAFSVAWLPDFYVRHLRDSDLTGTPGADPFQAFEFERSEARVELAMPLGASFDLRYHLGLAAFRHSAAFREFDSENLFAGLRLDQHLSRQLRLSYGVEFIDSQAQGYDQAGETLASSDDTDPSYRQLDLMLALRYRLSGSRRQTLFLQAEAGLRDYVTDKPTSAAPLHAGREDDLLRIYASWQMDLGRRYQLTVFAQNRQRSSSAPIDLDIGAEKDYDQYEGGLRLSARFGG